MAERARSIDALRGTVMVLMVLDHARDFFVGFGGSPTNLATTSVVLFFTRWVTHFCAPVFVLLAGTAAYRHSRKHGLAATRRFLWTRGLWLVFLELTIVRFAWVPDPFYHFSFVQVIWALGFAMLALSALIRLPVSAVLAIGALIVLGHNALDPLDARHFSGPLDIVWDFLHRPASLHFAARSLFIAYPVLPWVGVIAIGFALGQLFDLPEAERRRWLLGLGLGALATFVALRASNLYGNPAPWSVQPRGPVFTFLSFLNCEKYPPSLCYLLMTLGPALLVLRVFETTLRSTPTLELFGRVPLFFYVAHLYLLRFSAAPLAAMRFGSSAFQPPPGHAGSPECRLWVGYLAWALAILLLYPLCRWFARKKSHSRAWWFSYL